MHGEQRASSVVTIPLRQRGSAFVARSTRLVGTSIPMIVFGLWTGQGLQNSLRNDT